MTPSTAFGSFISLFPAAPRSSQVLYRLELFVTGGEPPCLVWPEDQIDCFPFQYSEANSRLLASLV